MKQINLNTNKARGAVLALTLAVIVPSVSLLTLTESGIISAAPSGTPITPPITIPGTPTPTPIATPTATPIAVTPSPTTTPTPDTPPVVNITYPFSGSTVYRGTTITIQANASDDKGITKVEFYANGRILCTDTVAPYNCKWYIKDRGWINLTAKAYDTIGSFSTNTIRVYSRGRAIPLPTPPVE